MTNPLPEGVDDTKVVAMFDDTEATDSPDDANRIEVEETGDDGAITSVVFIS